MVALPENDREIVVFITVEKGMALGLLAHLAHRAHCLIVAPYPTWRWSSPLRVDVLLMGSAQTGHGHMLFRDLWLADCLFLAWSCSRQCRMMLNAENLCRIQASTWSQA